MNVQDFDFDLPAGSIAQRPNPRGTSRLMTLDRASGAFAHRTIADLPGLLGAGDVLVLNDTRVVPARVFGTDADGRRTEFLLVARTVSDGGEEVWECLARPGRRAREGRTFALGERGKATVVGKNQDGRYRISITGTPVEDLLAEVGSAPLPPYIHRPGGVADAQDAIDYQTVYAREPGAIAAPTAGLHFTDALLAEIRARGVVIAPLTLHVGLGTFKPVKVETTEEHRMDFEGGTIPEETAARVNDALREGRRVVAVGTTSVRTLEASARAHGGSVSPGRFSTDLFLTPGSEFQVVGAMLTNFHLPRSTLLMLISAFAGRERVLTAYRAAVATGYRFFSYGDAMFIASAGS
ncbi:MAG: tRNA preQ1(34) S-adenosylmethionine ribosyltransferase-isomerase QueA [Thermoanaerobaculia bacterium]